MSNLNSRVEIPCPPGLSYTPFQCAGIRYMLQGKGTILADEMGLGKTIQAIGLINAFAVKADIAKPVVMIICPAYLRLTWEEELSKWLLAKAVIHIVPYSKLLNSRVEIPEYLDILILDEAHYIKNPESQRSQHVEAYTKLVRHHLLIMTGTPIENRPIELWPLVRLANPAEWDKNSDNPRIKVQRKKDSHPGMGPGFWEYAAKYCNLRKTQFRGYRGRLQNRWDFSGASNIDELSTRLKKSCFVRRKKVDVLPELPAKRRRLITLDPLKRAKDDDLFPYMNEGNYETVLKQMAAEKILFETYGKRRHEQALAKLGLCIEYITNVLDGTQKLIIFGHHTDVLEQLHKDLTALDYPCVLVTGKTPTVDRHEAMRQFQNDPTIRVFIGSIGAAGTGITLTAASHVVFIELDPRPGAMNQAEDRAHRMGQKGMVLIDHLVSNGSLCARIAKILIRKQEVISAIID